MIPMQEEKRLLNKTKEGDEHSFEQLEAQSREKVVLHIKGFLNGELEVEDIYQRGLIKAWEKINNFRGDCRFSTWLCRICHNLACDEFRKKNKRTIISYDDLISTNPRAEDLFANNRQVKTACENLQKKEKEKLLSEALSKLSLTHKEILLMYAMEDMTYKDIASRLRLSMGTVMSRIFHARRQARKIYKQNKRSK